jgi:hypothetical protein
MTEGLKGLFMGVPKVANPAAENHAEQSQHARRSAD